MVSVQHIWIGKIDRLSKQSNAIVKTTDVRSPDGRTPPTSSEINLGQLPEEVEGKEVAFAYDSGTYGICIEKRWTGSKYIQEMESRSGIDLGDIVFQDVLLDDQVIKSLSETQTLLATAWFNKGSSDSIIVSGDNGYLARITPRSGHGDWSCLGVVDGPIPPHELPTPVTVSEIHDTHLETKVTLTETDLDIPQQGDVVTVLTEEKTDQGTLALYESDYHLPVLIPYTKYPLNQELKVKITSQKRFYLTGEILLDGDYPDTFNVDDLPDVVLDQNRDSIHRIVHNGIPIDIRRCPVGSPNADELVVLGRGDEALTAVWNIRDAVGDVDIGEGDEIVLKIDHTEADSCIGFYQGFPVRCETTVALPDGCVGKEMRVTIQSVTADRATATPTSVPNAEGTLRSRIIGVTEGSALAVVDDYLLRIPGASIVSAGDTVDVVVEEKGETESVATVSARPIFKHSENSLLIRLPDTTGDVVHVDGTPVRVSHLPDVASPVTLGIEEVYSDHIVPTVTALPEAHLPRTGDYVTTKPERAVGSVVVGVGSELPIELPLLSAVDLDTVRARIVEIRRESIFAVVGGPTDAPDDRLMQYYEQLQFAGVAYGEGDYRESAKALAEAYDLLPERYPVLRALTTARQALVRAISSVESLEEIENAIEHISGLSERLETIVGDIDRSKELTTLLSAYQMEIAVAEQLLTVLRDVNQDSVSRHQSIARKVMAKGPVVSAVADIRSAKQSVANTRFRGQIPSLEIRTLADKLRDALTYPPDDLKSIRPPKESDDWFQYVISDDFYEQSKITLENATEEVDSWTRPEIHRESDLIVVSAGNQEASAEVKQSQKPDGLNTNSQDGSIDTGQSENEEDVTEAIAPDDEDSLQSGDAKSDGVESNVTTAADGSPTETSRSYAQPANRQRTEFNTDSDSSATSREAPAVSPATESLVPQTPIPDATEELKELRKQAEAEATEDPVRNNVKYSGSPYDRSDAIRKYALARADGICEACNEEAPFVKLDGSPYLEVHHVDELSAGGPDHPSFVAALCPTCHKRIHYGKGGDCINEKLKQRLEQGLGDVGSTVE